MVRIVRGPSGRMMDFERVDPALYLDHCSMRKIADDRARRDRFFKRLSKRGGTLFVSLANVVDIAGNTGLSAFKLGRFLERVGSRWCPLNMNPVAVAEAERNWRRGEQNPSFGWGFIEAYVSEATAPVFPP